MTSEGYCPDCQETTELNPSGFCTPCELRLRSEGVEQDLLEDMRMEAQDVLEEQPIQEGERNEFL